MCVRFDCERVCRVGWVERDVRVPLRVCILLLLLLALFLGLRGLGREIKWLTLELDARWAWGWEGGRGRTVKALRGDFDRMLAI